MEYFRKFLIFIRSTENLNQYKLKLSIMSLIAGIIGLVIGVLLDSLLPFEYFSNTARGIVALVVGVSLFIFSFLKAVEVSKKRTLENRYYQRMRERFSYRQRVNLSVVAGALVGIYILITSREGLMFTVNSSFAVYSALVLLAFSRKRRNEFIKDVYEIPDIRDMEHEAKRKSKKEKDEDDKK